MCKAVVFTYFMWMLVHRKIVFKMCISAGNQTKKMKRRGKKKQTLKYIFNYLEWEIDQRWKERISDKSTEKTHYSIEIWCVKLPFMEFYSLQSPFPYKIVQVCTLLLLSNDESKLNEANLSHT